MPTSARKENRWRKQLQSENDYRAKIIREIEAAYMHRNGITINTATKQHILPSKARVRNWMLLNADEYGSATQLVEAANCEFNLPVEWLDSESHWIWDIAVECID